jgi:hypothetical protein
MSNNSLVVAILSGIATGILANFLTPLVAKRLATYSTYIRIRNDHSRHVFENSVQYLIDNPLDAIHLRISLTERVILSVVLLVGALVLAAPPFARPDMSAPTWLIFLDLGSSLLVMFLSVLLGVLGVYYLIRSIKLARLPNAVSAGRSQPLNEIDLN